MKEDSEGKGKGKGKGKDKSKKAKGKTKGKKKVRARVTARSMDWIVPTKQLVSMGNMAVIMLVAVETR